MSSIPKNLDTVIEKREVSDLLREAFQRLYDLAGDLNDIDDWRRPHGDGESDLRIARWYRGPRDRRRRR